MPHLRTADAKAQQLAGSDVYRASHILYLDDHHRDWGAVRLNIEAMKAFTDTVEIAERVALAAHRAEVQDFISKGGLAAGVQFPWSAASHDTLEYVNYEYLKIASGFELHLKARLLTRDYVLHLIDGKLPIYKALAHEQRSRPILKSELLSVSEFHFDGSLNYLPGLTASSLKFSWLTDKPRYRAAIGLSSRDLDVIKDFRELRNQIHLPGELPETPALHSIGVPMVDFLLPFINKEIVTWSNQLIIDRGFTFRRLPELK
jgi:hypothetical protein